MGNKKSKIVCHTEEDEQESRKKKREENDFDSVVDQAWSHFRCFVDSESGVNDDLGEVDSDELSELIELLQRKNIEPFHLADLSLVKSKTQLLPVLISVASCILADKAIEEYLIIFEKQFTSGEKGQIDAIPIDDVKRHLNLSLRMFPQNAAAWAMAANFARMTLRLPNLEQKIAWYEKSADCASILRTQAIKVLNDEFGPVDIELKEWIELLLLNHVTGVELLIIPSNEQIVAIMNKDLAEGPDTNDNNVDENENNENKVEGDLEDGKEVWSPSSIEGTARYMLAMLNSISGKHDDALTQIKCFPHVSHRLHPNVWRNSSNCLVEQQTSRNQPRVYRKSNSGILPERLYAKLCQTFEPKAPYWIETDYSNRGYYSFFEDISKDVRDVNSHAFKPYNASNAIEDVVCNHLLPLARIFLKDAGKSELCTEICGYEWWIHTRTVQANLGHNLHFDTEESMLEQEKKISHPILSCVLYLTGGDVGGSTIVLDQTPNSTENAARGWISVPRDNQCLIFPGDLLHGVLPCPGDLSAQMEVKNKSSDELLRVVDLWKGKGSDQQNNVNRLTLMVGFWTRRVPDTMTERRLYGPCGPLPGAQSDDGQHEAEDESTARWVETIQAGYPYKEKLALENLEEVVSDNLRVVNDPWECIRSNETTELLHLEIPRGLDHRFFVSNPPQCFRDSLFESKDGNETESDGSEDDDSICSGETSENSTSKV